MDVRVERHLASARIVTKQLQQALQSLRRDLYLSVPDFASRQGDGVEHLDALITALTEINFQNNPSIQAPSEDALITEPGILFVRPSIAGLAHQVNVAKSEFKTFFSSFRGEMAVIQRNGQPERVNLGRAILFEMHLSHLSRMQAYREIKLLPDGIDRASYTHTFTRRVERISVAEALTMLLKKRNLNKLESSNQNVGVDVERVRSLPEDEPLALVSNHAENWRINLFRPEDKRPYKQVQSPIPVLSLMQKSDLKVSGLSSDLSMKGRAARQGDRVLVDTPITTTMSIYQYVDPQQAKLFKQPNRSKGYSNE